jgi:uncharacterized glyoxalase superfamily protein PhnB
MPSSPPKDFARITPYLYYEDAANAVDFLTRLRLHERFRVPGRDGKVMHAEVQHPEVHHWFFATHVKDVAPQDMHP